MMAQTAPIANDNGKWRQVHIPGQTVKYGNWEIAYNPPPMPARNCDWQFSHRDFDGAEDACDNRYGSAATLIDAMLHIDDVEDDRFEERGCDDCSMASVTSCLAVVCKHRDDAKARMTMLDAARAAVATNSGKD